MQRFISGLKQTGPPSTNAATAYNYVTYSGTAPSNAHGQGCRDTSGNFYFIDNTTTTAKIFKVTSGGSASSIATVTTSGTANRWQICYDSINNYLYASCSDTGTGLYRLKTDGTSLTRIQAQDSDNLPVGVCTDSFGNLYWLNSISANSNSGQIYRSTNPTSGTPTYSAYYSNGTAGTDNYYLAIDSSNNIYSSDTGNSLYNKISYVASPGTGTLSATYTNTSQLYSGFYDQVNQILWTASISGVQSPIYGYNFYNGVQTSYSLGTNASSIVSDSTGNLYLIGSANIKQYPGPFRVGDVVTDTAGNIYTCSAAGMPGTWARYPVYTGMGYQGVGLGGISVNVGETFPRQLTTANAGGTTGRLKTGLIYLTAGQVVSNIRFATGTTAGSSLTGTWGGLFTLSGSLLTLVAATAQQSLSTMAINTLFTWPIATIASGSSSTYTVPTSGIYYVGFCITGTPPTTVSTTLANGLYATTPYMSVYATGSTNPPAIGTTYSFAIDTILSYYALS
jgi:hypothetical protein